MNTITPGFCYLDRHRVPLVVGQTVKVQYCSGRYGQVSQATGVLLEIDRYSGIRIRLAHEHRDAGSNRITRFLNAGDEYYIASVFAYDGGQTWTGFDHYGDFEHGHDKWIEILAA